MAIIKRTPRPGELVRGATAGDLAAFGPDGELVDSGLATADVPEWPEGGNEGDVMTKGATGPEWSPPKGAYHHSIRVRKDVYITILTYGTQIIPVILKFDLTLSRSAPITSFDDLLSVIGDEFDADHTLTGCLMTSGTATVTIGEDTVTLNLIWCESDGHYKSGNSLYTPSVYVLFRNSATGEIVGTSKISVTIEAATVDDKVIVE